MPPIVTPRQFDSYKKLIHESPIPGDYLTDLGRSENDQEGVELLKGELEKADRSKPLFVFDFLYSTHNPYYFPVDKALHKTCFREDSEKNEEKKKLLNRYHRSVIYTDQLIGEILRAAERRRPKGEFVFIFAGDHGEEFWEFGGEGHAGVRFQDVRTRVPMIFCLPEAIKTTIALSESKDLLPTLLDWAGAADTEKLNRYFNGHSLFKKNSSAVGIISGGDFPTGGRNLALVSETRKYELLMPATNPMEFDLLRISDLNDERLKDTPEEHGEFQKILALYKKGFGTFFKDINKNR